MIRTKKFDESESKKIIWKKSKKSFYVTVWYKIENNFWYITDKFKIAKKLKMTAKDGIFSYGFQYTQRRSNSIIERTWA